MASGPAFHGNRNARATDLDVVSAQQDSEEDIVALPRRDYSWPELDHLYVSARLPRPRLGARFWVRTHVRRFIKALFNNVLDFRECNMLNAAKLLVMCVAYVEEHMTEWLAQLSQSLIKFYAGKAYVAGSAEVCDTYDLIGVLTGSYIPPSTIWMQYKDAFAMDTIFYLEQRLGVFHILKNCLLGAVGSLEQAWDGLSNLTKLDAQSLGHLEKVLPDLIERLFECDLIHECGTTDGLPIATTLWNLAAAVARVSRVLSRELRSRLLIISVALLHGLSTGGSAAAADDPVADWCDVDSAASGGSDSTALAVSDDVEVDSSTRSFHAAGKAFTERVSCPITATAKGLAAAGREAGRSTSSPLSAVKKFQLMSRQLNLHVQDVSSEVVVFAKGNFNCFRSFVELVPVEVVVEAPAVWECLRSFADAGEESKTRLSALKLCLSLVQRGRRIIGGDSTNLGRLCWFSGGP